MHARSFAAAAGLVLAGLMTPHIALAQVDYGSDSPVPAPAGRSGWTVGLGAAGAPDYEGSSDYKAVPIPYLRWQGGNRYFDLLGLTAKGNVLDNEFIEFGPRLRIRSKRDNVENDRVDDLESTDTAVEIGAFVGLKYERWGAEAWFSQDVADSYSGQLAGLKGGYTWPINESWVLRTDLTTTYASGKYMDTYFGIDRRDSQRSGLRQFDADAGFKDVGGDVALSYTGWERWGVTGAFSYDRLLNDAEDSPVTKEGSADQFLFGILVTYQFAS